MKKIVLMAMAAAFVCGCEKAVFDDDGNVEVNNDAPAKDFTFTVKGDFGAATFTRGYLQADGHEMTDLWVFDYVDGRCCQSIHQSSGDADWGRPKMSLTYGTQHVFFVASRGEGATLDEEGHSIVWEGPRDTFWKDYEVDVVSTSNGNRAVTLARVATKLKVTVSDEVPAACKAVVVTPARWYYGWDYVNGIAKAMQKTERSVTVPESYAGTSGQLSLAFFGLSGNDEWVTDADIRAVDGEDNVIGAVTISRAPFKANRCTEYSGSLFGSAGGFDLGVSETWDAPKTFTW